MLWVPAIIEAEENFLIDCQFLLQETLVDKGISLAELAEKAGVSEADISQCMGPEANPTVKMFARLFRAAGEKLCVGTETKKIVSVVRMKGGE
jgi:DNA-binding phage protein